MMDERFDRKLIIKFEGAVLSGRCPSIRKLTHVILCKNALNVYMPNVIFEGRSI
jgi:hypothetical protein